MNSKTGPTGATSGPDLSGLKVPIHTQNEINELEAACILRATAWAYRSRTLKRGLLSATGLLTLHGRMYGEVWEWAGKFRTEDLNLGIPYAQVQTQLKILFGNVEYWLEHETYPLDEICMRFHHELARIHPFKNGNGRFARLAANLLVEQNGGDRFTWGKVNLAEATPARQTYISALQHADETSEVDLLLEFARS